MLNAIKPFIEFYRVASFASPHQSHDYPRRFWQGITLGWHAAARYKRLSLLSDEALARRGLDRASIGRHAFFGDPPFSRD